uniref:Endonuclease/exonuclease/phosphatase domain-containing protein n=1 Tax=Cajanus cajan TaxID=3821 RepID=A0A151RL53_CAJCA|nr:hypothetical protein KK1_035324 [Cajanus cajan]
MRHSSANFLGVCGWWREEKIFCIFVNVYAPCDYLGKKDLWLRLAEVKRRRGGVLWCFNGDFNVVKSDLEQKGSILEWRRDDIRCFYEFIEDVELADLPLIGRKYTWYKPDGSCMSRLDRFLVSPTLLVQWRNFSQRGLSRGISDHCVVLLKFEDIDWGPKPFKVLDCWRFNPTFEGFVREK